MPHYLTIHHEPAAPAEVIESRWIQLSQERRSIWRKTWYNLGLGKRFCWWDAPSRESLEQIFQDHLITWDEIIQVDLTTPSDWTWRED